MARRREQLGPVNPLAQEEYAEAVAHVEELEAQRSDLETALRELEKLIADTDKQIRTTFDGRSRRPPPRSRSSPPSCSRAARVGSGWSPRPTVRAGRRG